MYFNEKIAKKIIIYNSDYIIENHDKDEGEIIIINNLLNVFCNDGYIIIKELKVEGKKKMTTKDLLNGFKIEKNSYFK